MRGWIRIMRGMVVIGYKLRIYPPALLIHSRYASACLSTTCCLRSFRNERRFSTRSRSLANSLYDETKPEPSITQPTQTASAAVQTQTAQTEAATRSTAQADRRNRQTDKRQKNSVWIRREPGKARYELQLTLLSGIKLQCGSISEGYFPWRASIETTEYPMTLVLNS